MARGGGVSEVGTKSQLSPFFFWRLPLRSYYSCPKFWENKNKCFKMFWKRFPKKLNNFCATIDNISWAEIQKMWKSLQHRAKKKSLVVYLQRKYTNIPWNMWNNPGNYIGPIYLWNQCGEETISTKSNKETKKNVWNQKCCHDLCGGLDFPYFPRLSLLD